MELNLGTHLALALLGSTALSIQGLTPIPGGALIASRAPLTGYMAGPHELGASPSFSVACADLDLNGFDDVVFGNITQHPNEVWLAGVSPCAERLVLWQVLNGASSALPNGNNTHCVVLADLDGNGSPDLLVGNNFERNLVYQNLGSDGGHWRGFAATPTAQFGDASSFTWGLAVGDVDGDGSLDVVEGRNNGQSTLVWFGDGAGGFDPTPLDFGDSGATRAVAVGHFDDNSFLDVAVGNFGRNLLLLQSAVGFSPVLLAADDDTTSLAVGDFWEDVASRDDLIVGNLDMPSQIVLSLGGGSFSSTPLDAITRPTESVAAGDLDGDGHLDVVLGNSGATDSLVWLGDGTGGFALSPMGSLATGDTYAVAIGGLDSVAPLDIVAGNRNMACGAGGTFWLGQ